MIAIFGRRTQRECLIYAICLLRTIEQHSTLIVSQFYNNYQTLKMACFVFCLLTGLLSTRAAVKSSYAMRFCYKHLLKASRYIYLPSMVLYIYKRRKIPVDQNCIQDPFCSRSVESTTLCKYSPTLLRRVLAGFISIYASLPEFYQFKRRAIFF